MNVILEQLKTHTQNKPNDIALHIDDETITYSQLNARITSAVESLQKYSLNPVVAINYEITGAKYYLLFSFASFT